MFITQRPTFGGRDSFNKAGQKMLSFPITFQDFLGSVGRGKNFLSRKIFICHTGQTYLKMARKSFGSGVLDMCRSGYRKRQYYFVPPNITYAHHYTPCQLTMFWHPACLCICLSVCLALLAKWTDIQT